MTIYIHNKKEYTLPDNWNELSARQLIQLMDIKDQDTTEAYLLRALHVLLGYGKMRFYFMPLDAKFYLLPFVRWVMESNDIINNPITEYAGLLGPASEFDNLRMAEFRVADLHYRLFQKNPSDEHLNNLIAVLYRPMRTDGKLDEGDMREPFNPNTVANRVQAILRWPKPVKQAILFWYEGCMSYMVGLYDLAFSGGQQQAQTTNNIEDGFFGMMRDIAKKGIYGDFNAVENMYVHLVFREVEEQMKEAQRQEELNNQNTTHV
jgi:hypothetical protein